MKELFEKVYIKSEANLPKKENQYYLSHIRGQHDHAISCKYFEIHLSNWWANNIDWYLLPIEPNIDKAVIEKVKSEIGKVQPSGFKLLTHYYPKDAEEQIDDIFAIIAALKSESKEGEQKWSTKASDYAEAFKQNPTNANFMQAMELTDEEWLNLPKEEILQLYKNCYGMLMQYVQGKDSREEIVKDFVDFLSDEGYDVPVHRSVIEKYLQSGEVKETKE